MNVREELDKIVSDYRGDPRIVDRLIEAGYRKPAEVTGQTIEQWMDDPRTRPMGA